MATALDEETREYLMERYDELGFTTKEASQLVDSEDHEGKRLDWRKVKKMIDGGCGHKLAIRILTP
jgi:hypothetical protein